MTQNFKWTENYYNARVILGFSEIEFWQSCPRKIYALLAHKGLAEGHLRLKQSTKEKAQEILNLI